MSLALVSYWLIDGYLSACGMYIGTLHTHASNVYAVLNSPCFLLRFTCVCKRENANLRKNVDAGSAFERTH